MYTNRYEWWLLEEAKKRNPSIKTYALSWAVPAWVGDGTPNGFFTEDNLEYHLKWIQGLKVHHNIQLDFMGIWNERDCDPTWTVKLREKLNNDPMGVGQNVTLVAAGCVVHSLTT